MAEIKNQWLVNSNNEKIAPYTTINQVLENTTGKGLDIILNEMQGKIGDNQLNIDNTYFLSQEIKSNETEEAVLKRLLEIPSFKVIILDSSVIIKTGTLEIPSNTYLIGGHKGITISTNERLNTLLAFSTTTQNNQEVLSNIYVSNLTIKSPSVQNLLFQSAIKIGVENGELIQCSDCVLDNITIEEEKFFFRTKNLVIKNMTSQQGGTIQGDNNICTNITLTGGSFELNGNNNVLSNFYMTNTEGAFFTGNSNIYDNIICSNNSLGEIGINGNNNVFKGSLIHNINNNDCEFIVENSSNNIIFLQCIPAEQGGNTYAIKEEPLSNNQFYINSPEGAYINGYNLLNKWASSDFQTAAPLLLNTEGALTENQMVKELGNGQYLINGSFEDVYLPFVNFVDYPQEGSGKYIYPLSIKNITPLSENGEIYIFCSTGGDPALQKSFQIYPNDKHPNIFYTQYPAIELYLNGTFENEIFSLQTILSTSNNKMHIGG